MSIYKETFGFCVSVGLPMGEAALEAYGVISKPSFARFEINKGFLLFNNYLNWYFDRYSRYNIEN